MRRVVLVSLLLVLGAPPAAQAGTVSLGRVATDPKYGNESPVLEFTAAPGEINRITLTTAGTPAVPVLVLHDAGAPVRVGAPMQAGPGAIAQPGSGCSAIDERTVSCVAHYASVRAGDGDDTVSVPPPADPGNLSYGYAYVRGEEGADTLSGPGFLAGGPGNDVLTCPEPCAFSQQAGGPGDDSLRGGNAADFLSGDGDGPPSLDVINPRFYDSGAVGNDRLDGGPGRDEVSFSGQSAGVRVDLAAGTASRGGAERDTLTGLENVAGGDGDDLLLGDAGANRLEGGAGDDRLSGRGGSDSLFGDVEPDTNDDSVGYTPGTDGADTLHGGDGDDRLDAGAEAGDALDGGPGDDTLENGLYGPTRAKIVRCGTGRDRLDFTPAGQRVWGCERLGVGAMQISIRPQRRANGRLRFAWSCAVVRPSACMMTIGVRARSSKVARRRLSLSGPMRGEFLMRPARAPRRGNVIDVTIDVSISTGEMGEHGPVTNEGYHARWRVVV
jgi:hypothetical protein